MTEMINTNELDARKDVDQISSRADEVEQALRIPYCLLVPSISNPGVYSMPKV